MHNFTLMRFTLCFAVLVTASFMTVRDASAQDLGRPRSITSDDFVKKRPTGNRTESAPPSANKTSGKDGASQKPRAQRSKAGTASRYRLGRAERVSRRPGAKPTVVRVGSKNIEIAEVGVTMWKLRPPAMGEEGHRFQVSTDGGREYWLAERIAATTRLAAGDKVRIAIESSSEGYLYVINSEYYADGSYGAPTMIFPSGEKDNNFVLPGQLVDIPDQSEELPYFVITPNRAGYLGESLTVIVSPVKLTNFRLGVGGRIENIDDLISIEARADFDVYSRTDNSDKLYSETEASSACGARTRQLVRADVGASACGERTRQLTREEAKPQTIYRVRTEKLQAAVAFVKIKVGK